MAKRKAKKKDRTAKDAAPSPAVTAGRASAADRLRPWLLGATVALFVVPPLLPTESSGRTGEMLPVVMLLIILAMVWAASRIGMTGWRLKLQATDLAVLALVALHTISSLLATRDGHARPAVNMLWLWIGMGLAYFLLRQLLDTAREARALAVVMISLAVALSVYGLWQYAYEFPQLRAEYAKNPDAMLKSQGMWYPPDSPERAQFENRLASREPLATYALTNSLAGYLAPWLVVTTGIVLLAGWKRRRLFLAACLCGILIAASLVLSKSRSGYAATGLGIALTAFYCSKFRVRVAWRWLLVGVLVAAVLGGLALAVGGLDMEVLSETSKSLGYRVQYWKSTARMIADHPIYGCGPGQFQGKYTLYKLPEASEEIAEPHNFLLEVWATAGTPAALALIAVLGCFAWAITHPNTNPKRKRGESASDPSGKSDRANSSGPSLALRVSEAQEDTPAETSHEDDATAWVLGGGVVGLLAAWPLGMMAAIPPSLAMLLVGAPLGILAGYFLYDWVKYSLIKDGTGCLSSSDEQQCSNSTGWQAASATLIAQQPLAGLAMITLLVNLLAAGGIGFAGVAGSLWILLALGLFSPSPRESRPLRPLAAPTMSALLAILGVMCYATGYSPVLNCESHTQAALNDPARAREHLQSAAMADPLSAQPCRQLAMLYFDAWRHDQNLQNLQKFEKFMTIGLELDPASSSAWLMSADHYIEAYAHTRRPADLEHAVAACRRAVELYPADATTRAKFALALRVAGKAQESAKEAEMAEKLDSQTPHTDRKIPESLRSRLIQTPE